MQSLRKGLTQKLKKKKEQKKQKHRHQRKYCSEDEDERNSSRSSSSDEDHETAKKKSSKPQVSDSDSPDSDSDMEDMETVMDRLPDNPGPLLDFANASQGILLLLVLKQHLKGLYGFSDRYSRPEQWFYG